MTSNKYAMTGHTKGIGERLFEILSPNVIGFSKSTGYDILNKNDRQRIIKESRDCDVFINNAHDGFGQTYLFLDLLNEWNNDPSKTIINVGSRIAEITLSFRSRHLINYQSQKLILKEMSFRVPEGHLCKVNYRWFAYVGTKSILEKYPHFTEKDYISVDEACEMILS